MESLQWYALGIITMLTLQGLVYAQMAIKLKWYTLPLMLVGLAFVLFGLAWCGSSFLEGYPQSGAMGLTIFSGAGLIIMIQTWRLLVAPGLKR